MSQVRAKIGNGGRIVIPAMHRKALGLEAGDDVVLSLEENSVRIIGLRHAVQQAQALVRQYVPDDHRLSEILIAERRKEARGE